MITYNEDSQTQFEHKQIRWGTRFKSAREEMRLTEKEVALRLHLKSHMIVAIEDGTIGKAFPPIFARGYLRSYAHLLSFPEKDIEQALTELDLAPPPSAVVQYKLPKRQIENPSSSGGWGTLLVITILAILVGIWWNTHVRNAPTFNTIPESTSLDQQPAQAESLQAPAPTNAEPLPPELTHSSLPAAPATIAPVSAPTPEATESAAAPTAPEASSTSKIAIPKAGNEVEKSGEPEVKATDSPATSATAAEPAYKRKTAQKEVTSENSDETVNDQSESVADTTTESADNSSTTNDSN